MKKLFFLIVAIFIGVNLSAQELPIIIPPSPNASSLGKYLETPVSYATGIPSISVPLYEIREGNISLPINLSYHAGGIKVEEVASWVGLGWDLNAGGVIYRTMQGLPDDSPNGYINTTHTVEEMANCTYLGNIWHNNISSLDSNLRDYEPDIFNYNFSGYSGRFVYDQTTDQFIQTPYSNIIITPIKDSNGLEIISWVFSAPDGVKYYFGKSKDNLRTGIDQNPSSNSYSYSNHNFSIPNQSSEISNFISSWYLMDIVSPTNQQIKFSYQKQLNINLFNKTSESFIHSGTSGCNSDDYSVSFSESYVEQSVLEFIEFSNGKIEFIEDIIGRLDLLNSRALKTIKIYHQDSLFKQFNLNQDYTISPIGTDEWVSLGNANERRYRLRLTSVEEENKIGQKLPPYSFEYNPIELPSRFSNAQDYWGYYNAKTNNPSLIPETKITFSSPLYIGEANRTVDPVNSQAGMLTKVNYPTGGSTEYKYESNTASSVISKASIDYNIRNRDINYSFTFVKAPDNIDSSLQYNYSKNFTIDSNKVGPIYFSVSVTGCSSPDILADFSCDYFIEVIGVTDPLYRHGITGTSFNLELPSGSYKIVAIELGDGLGDPLTTDFSVLMNWTSDPNPEYLNVGGQRVKKIILNDDGGRTIEKTYNYDFFGQNLTSGYIISTPIFLDDQFFNGACSPNAYVLKITSYSQAPMVFVNGNVLGYRNVTEIRSDSVKTEYVFSMVGDIAHQATGSTFSNVLVPDLYFNWLRGELLTKESFKINNNIYSKVETVTNVFENVGTYFINNLGLKLIFEIKDPLVLNLATKHAFYSGASEWHRLKKTTTTDYFDTGDITVSQDYVYDNNPLLASKSIVSSSNNKTLVSKNYYPKDKAQLTDLKPTSSIAIDKLITQHQIAQPIQSETYMDINNNGNTESNELLGTQRTNFKEWFTDIILPETIQTSKGEISQTNQLENRIVFHDYYANGNVKEVSKEDGTHVVYIWGYNETQPIAKIESATFAEVSSYVINLQTKSNLDIDHCREVTCKEQELRDVLNNLRNPLFAPNLSKSQITTYTYDPLIGVTSITDPRGETIYYHYDNFNRLEYVKDAQGKILSKNEYHYKNQQ